MSISLMVSESRSRRVKIVKKKKEEPKICSSRLAKEIQRMSVDSYFKKTKPTSEDLLQDRRRRSGASPKRRHVSNISCSRDTLFFPFVILCFCNIYMRTHIAI
ncbi:hypothetical protein VNO80_03597 [Phaseolus coccineus]|uniref:Uncharacterized protein n=1 Tax=Phaseolus coccineus TaxID=3886 RepID=A0AAN9NTG6_PHACN